MNSEIASKLLALRKQAGFSQEELAEKLGVSRQAVSKWERGEASPDTDNLIQIAKIYSISLDKLFGIESEPVSQRSVINIDKNQPETSEEYPRKMKVMYPEGSAESEIYTSQGQAESEPVNEKPYMEPETNYANYYNYNYETVDDTPENANSSEHYYQGNSSVTDDIAEKIMTDDDFYKKLMTFPYPILITALYLVLGAVLNWWHPMWMLFLTIPLYYTAIPAIKHRNPNIFCYPVAVTLAYLIAGFMFRLWHPGWISFMSIPFYYICFANNGRKNKAKHKRKNRENFS